VHPAQEDGDRVQLRSRTELLAEADVVIGADEFVPSSSAKSARKVADERRIMAYRD